jgi:hypothetical protein
VIAHSFDRYGCQVGKRPVTYQNLSQKWVCDKCGGRIVHRITWDESQDKSIDFAECADCEGRDFIRESQFERQVSEGYEVLVDLPADIAATLK